MKTTKIIIALLALLPFSRAFAQEGEILYTDFEPDSGLYVNLSYEELSFDLNYDGNPDLHMSYYQDSGEIQFRITTISNNLGLCIRLEENDTIANATDWRTQWKSLGNPNDLTHIGFRFETAGDYYYGWIRLGSNLSQRFWYFDEFAYCTIHNYPLRWGQTELVGIEGNNVSYAMAIIHPNPVTSKAIIVGKNLRKAEVINTLGQQMLSVQGEGNELHIDMAAQPAGVYFVTITDEEGRKCVRKILKE